MATQLGRCVIVSLKVMHCYAIPANRWGKEDSCES